MTSHSKQDGTIVSCCQGKPLAVTACERYMVDTQAMNQIMYIKVSNRSNKSRLIIVIVQT